MTWKLVSRNSKNAQMQGHQYFKFNDRRYVFDSLPLYCAVEGNRNEEKANGFPSIPRYLMYFVDCILF